MKYIYKGYLVNFMSSGRPTKNSTKIGFMI